MNLVCWSASDKLPMHHLGKKSHLIIVYDFSSETFIYIYCYPVWVYARVNHVHLYECRNTCTVYVYDSQRTIQETGPQLPSCLFLLFTAAEPG